MQKKSTLFLSLLILLLNLFTIASCISNSSEEELSPPPDMPVVNFEQSPLEGSWHNLCSLNSTNGDDDFRLAILQGNRLSMISYAVSSLADFDQKGQIIWQGLFQIDPAQSSPENSGGTFHFWITSVLLIPLDNDRAAALNQNGFCGITQWEEGVETNITGLICKGTAIPGQNSYRSTGITFGDSWLDFDSDLFSLKSKSSSEAAISLTRH